MDTNRDDAKTTSSSTTSAVAAKDKSSSSHAVSMSLPEQHHHQIHQTNNPQQRQPQHIQDQQQQGDASSPPPHHLSSSRSTTAATTPTSSATGGSSNAASPEGHQGGGGSTTGPQHPAVSSAPVPPPTASTTASTDVSAVTRDAYQQHFNTHHALPPDQTIAPSASGTSTATTSLQQQFPSAIKLLVSNNVAGSIIGRSGQTISELQTQSSTRIKLSQSGDYFPGTQDRVCLIQGHPDNVKKAISLILSRLFALQQQHHFQYYAWHNTTASQQQHQHAQGHRKGSDDPGRPASPPSFAFVVKVLVPTPSCGMIIGKGGSNVKSMVEASGVSSVRLSPKEGGADPSIVGGPGVVSLQQQQQASATAALVSATSERVVTITGPTLDSCVNCMFIILDGMTSHPEMCRYMNMTTSYSRVLSAAQNAYGAAAAIGGPTLSSAGSGLSSDVGGVSASPSMNASTAGSTTMGLWDPSMTQQQPHSVAATTDSKMSGGDASGETQGVIRPGTYDSSLPSMFADQIPRSVPSPAALHGNRGDNVTYSPVFDRSAAPVSGPPFLPPSPAAQPIDTTAAAAASPQHGNAFQQHPSPSRSMHPSQHPGAAAGVYLVPTTGMPYVPQQQGLMSGGAGGNVPEGMTGARSASDLLALQIQDQRQQQHAAGLSSPSTPARSSPAFHHQHSHGSPAVGSHGQLYPTSQQHQTASQEQQQQPGGFTAQVAIPDSLIGSILGRGGRTLNELQMLSNTKIRISQRGEYVPGTKNRIVTIRGQTAQSVSTAQFLMSQRMVLPPTASLGGGRGNVGSLSSGPPPPTTTGPQSSSVSGGAPSPTMQQQQHHQQQHQRHDLQHQQSSTASATTSATTSTTTKSQQQQHKHKPTATVSSGTSNQGSAVVTNENTSPIESNRQQQQQSKQRQTD